MKEIEKVYVGGWFQRTTLQLSEIYDFLREGTSPLKLSAEKLRKNHKALEITDVNLGVDGLEHISIQTALAVNLKIYEDGLIILSGEASASPERAIKSLTDYYENRLSPALSYIFSLGAPVPKELANIQTIYPYFITLHNQSRQKITELLENFNQQKYFEILSNQFDLFRGNELYIINLKDHQIKSAERFIEEQIFLREFKGQLHHYLNLHRIIWEKIDEVKQRKKIRGGDVAKFKDKLEGYDKTVNLIEARINQMSTYLRTRERIARHDDQMAAFEPIVEYRYETLGDTLEYMKQIWQMTKNYVKSAFKLFSDLQEQATQNSLSGLTVVTSMGVGASLIELFANDAMPTVTIFGIAYFVILALVGFFTSKIIGTINQKRKYEVSDVDFDRNIK
jgi:hypothetical protein